jgi:hypothetical protein
MRQLMWKRRKENNSKGKGVEGSKIFQLSIFRSKSQFLRRFTTNLVGRRVSNESPFQFYLFGIQPLTEEVDHELAELRRRSASQHQDDQARRHLRPRRKHLGFVRRFCGNSTVITTLSNP